MDTAAVVISDQYRAKITAERHEGGLLIRGPRSFLLLSDTECERLASFITGKPHIQRYAAMARDRTETDKQSSRG